VPAVLLKAIAWVESGWRQEAAPGVPLVGPGGGYGVMQITDALGVGAVTGPIQSAITSNYIYNIAYGAQALTDKWLGTPAVGGRDPRVLEYWYNAVWAYNGWGWANDPRNPTFSRTGTPATDPWAYPYQERVYYWVAHPPRGTNGRPLWPAVAVSLPDARAETAARGSALAATTGHVMVPGTPGPLVPCAAPPGTGAGASQGTTECAPHGDAAYFLNDLSLPDLSTVPAGHLLLKGWQLRNTGGTFWNSAAAGTAGYHLQRIAAAGFGGETRVDLPEVPPLASVAVRASVTAPNTPGMHTAQWQMQDGRGHSFGPVVWIRVTVQKPLDPAPVPTAGPAIISTRRLSAVEAVPARTSDARYVADLSIPDGTLMAPGQHFQKGWMMRNVGTETWNLSYHLSFEAGTPMGPHTNVRSGIVPPGATYAFTVTLIAPTHAGSYRAIWQMTDGAGHPFGQQIWVSITVGSKAPATGTPSPPARATPTVAVAPVETSTPPAEAPPTATPALAPTVAPPATAAPDVWLGPVAETTYFADGSTRGRDREYVSLLNPGAAPADVRLTLYRENGATRVVSFALAPLELRSLDVGGLAPHSSVSLRVESDRPVTVERAMYSGSGGHVAAALVPARHWSFVHWLRGSGYDEWLHLFNPGDQAVAATVVMTPTDGAARRAVVSVPPLTRVSLHVTRYLGSLSSADIAVDAERPLVAEHTASLGGGTTVLGQAGVSSPSTTWYFADSRTDGGRAVYVPVMNPGASAATVTLTLLMSDGSWQERFVVVPPRSSHVFGVHHLVQGTSSLIVRSTVPVYAEESAYPATGQGGTLIAGVPGPARVWSLAEGYASADFTETLTILNPGEKAAMVHVRYAQSWGHTADKWIRVAARSRVSWAINADVRPGNVAAVVSSDVPVIVGRTEAFGSGLGLTATQAVQPTVS
jgi:hypothetical protein